MLGICHGGILLAGRYHHHYHHDIHNYHHDHHDYHCYKKPGIGQTQRHQLDLATVQRSSQDLVIQDDNDDIGEIGYQIYDSYHYSYFAFRVKSDIVGLQGDSILMITVMILIRIPFVSTDDTGDDTDEDTY